MTWSGAVAPTAIELLSLADPAGGFTALAAAPAGAGVELADSLGPIDSARAGRAGAAFSAAAHTGAVRMTVGGQTATTAGRDSLALRHAVVLGRAAWEARFVIAALEERAWTVDARLAVAPGIAVTQGRPLPLDTARHTVVVALDSLAAADAAAIQRFVAGGGGAVLAPSAAATLRAIAPGRVGPHVRPTALTFASASPAAALAMDPVVPASDAVVLERHGTHVVLAARRHAAGRVVQTGYDETWRWRMGGLDGAADAHREWWASVVSAAAYQPGIGDRVSGIGSDRAPLASLVAALGPASQPRSSAAPLPDLRNLLPAAAVLLFLCLMLEWSSRRLRGAA